MSFATDGAADWRHFGRLPGFTNCKPKYRQATGLFPFVRLCSYGGKQYTQAEAFFAEVTASHQAREAQREQRRFEQSLPPRKGTKFRLSLERFRTHPNYHHRPAAADIAFCVAAFACDMTEDSLPHALPTTADPSRRHGIGSVDKYLSICADFVDAVLFASLRDRPADS